MIDFIQKIVIIIMGNNPELSTIVLSMIPLFEVKSSIPFGMSSDIWQEYALNGFSAYLYSMIGGAIIICVLFFVSKPIIKWLKDKKLFQKSINSIEGDIKKKASNISNKKSQFLKWICMLLFVAFPLPMTGVWTGTFIAVVLNFNFFQTFSCVFIGNCICGIIILFASSLLRGIEIYLFLFIVLFSCIFVVIKCVIGRKNKIV